MSKDIKLSYTVYGLDTDGNETVMDAGEVESGLVYKEPKTNTITIGEDAEKTDYPCHKCKKTIKEHKPDAEKG